MESNQMSNDQNNSESGLGSSRCSTADPFQVGRVFAAKKPKRVGFPGVWNDRQIVWVGIDQIQYDSPTVRQGRRYPIVSKQQFEKWAGLDVTEQMPKDEWRS